MTLLDSLNSDESARLEDYLNDKFQTAADLRNLEELLQNVKDQEALLREQLRETNVSLEQAQKASRAHASSALEEAEAFARHQADIDRRLMVATRSETSDEAAAKFQKSFDILQRLDLAQGYVELLREVDNLRTEAGQKIRISPQAALQPYTRLQQISSTLKARRPAAEDAAPHLVYHVERVTTAVWKEMRDILATELEGTLTKIHWPSPILKMNGQLLEEWEQQVKKLLDLQEPELLGRETAQDTEAAKRPPSSLLPLDVMMKALELRFRYHFDGERRTNRLDKPEYSLSHILDLVDSYNSFFVTYLQPVLTTHFQSSPLAKIPIYIDATAALITALLPMLRRKILGMLPDIAKQPQLLSHLIHELISFDTTLRDEWGYGGGNGGDEVWKGLTWEVLVLNGWFGKWLSVERDFALSRYQNIIDSPDAGEIDLDSVEPSVTKPTKAAIRVNDLLETITERYRPLLSFSQKLSFLIDVQIAMLDRFHNRLHSGLEAYLAATSSVVRAVQGVSKEDRAGVEGINGLERLCRVYGSAEYLEKAMEGWSDDIFFLSLYAELQSRARSAQKDTVGPMSMSDVALRTSTSIGDEDSETGGLFDETATAYRKLRERTEGLMGQRLGMQARQALTGYLRINPWTSVDSSSLSDDADDEPATTTPELQPLLSDLSRTLSFLAPRLALPPLRRIARSVLEVIQRCLWDVVLMRHSLSPAAVVQFRVDLEAIWAMFDGTAGLGRGWAERVMRKLSEGESTSVFPEWRSEESE
ncbi:MAG: hypothetical protein M1817_004276 [Caeruleum heppii]|nr:MAG: hypothetical protein M1817_004276 [Caeruleum heppii]